jgi:hypothetical protein
MSITSDPVTEHQDASEKENQRAISRRLFRQMSAPDRNLEDTNIDEFRPIQPGEQVEMTQPQAVAKKRRSFHFMPAFWTIVSIFSLVVNVILVVVLVSILGQVFQIKNAINNQLIKGLEGNFALMDQARIKTTINVSTNVPAKFSLPLKTETMVALTKDTAIKAAHVSLTTGGLQITNAPANIVLPAGTQLPIQLEISVPVDQQIPVNLTVPVDIPLSQTDLHQPFTGLQNVVKPYRTLMDTLPGSWQEVICGAKPSDLCKSLVP